MYPLVKASMMMKSQALHPILQTHQYPVLLPVGLLAFKLHTLLLVPTPELKYLINISEGVHMRWEYALLNLMC